MQLMVITNNNTKDEEGISLRLSVQSSVTSLGLQVLVRTRTGSKSEEI